MDLKKLFLTAAAAIFACFGAASHPLAAQSLDEYEKGPWGFQWTRRTLARDQAVEDIAANMRFLLLVRKEFESVPHLEWAIPIAEKLPSQPVAVVQLMTRAEGAVEQMCPRMVIEGAISYYEYKPWLERSVAALEAFTMRDAAEEKTRRACLAGLKRELEAVSAMEPWD